MQKIAHDFSKHKKYINLLLNLIKKGEIPNHITLLNLYGMMQATETSDYVSIKLCTMLKSVILTPNKNGYYFAL